jgi:SAM-dependent methyltransferase
MFVTDPPDALAPYYSVGYHDRPDSVEALDRGLANQRYKIDLVTRFQPRGRLLEIGPSTGYFCRLAKLAGFEVSAIELDAECAAFLSDKLGVRAIASGDPAAVLAREDRCYDAICLWHSLEHMPAPWAVLEQAIARLAPGGVLVVAAPNPLSWQARVMGARWPHYDLPRHLTQIPIPWLLRFAGDRGLTTELVTTRDAGSRAVGRVSWAMLRLPFAPHPRLESLPWRVGLLLGRLLAPWEGREGRGGAYTAVFRRPL